MIVVPAIITFVAISGVIALHVAALQEAEFKLLLPLALRKWASYLVIGALMLLWLKFSDMA